jgi:predicted RNA-binding Zn-ribbon protein involved in translation (DUF1610 family)
MIWLLGILSVGVWMAYLACGLLIAKVCAAGSAGLRAFYWVLPLVVGTFSASALIFMGEHSKATLRLRGWLALAAVMTLFGYLVQWMVQMYIFKCRACGITRSTYRTAWTRGIYTCPNCKRQYFKGVPGPV